MIDLQNEDLSKYTTVRIGGTADRLLIPESTSELIDIVNRYSPKYFIGGGSNLLISNRHFDLVVGLKSFDDSIQNLGNGQYRVGGSVKLAHLISIVNDDGYGGIEYLCNVPGLIGGAVAMNAGTGKKENRCISDYIESVTVLNGKKQIVLEKNDCRFGHRNSIFREIPDMIVLSVLFKFIPMSREDSDTAKKQKLEYYRNKQDPSHPNFGSVFRSYDNRIMSAVKKLKIGKRVQFSGKTRNWILNTGNGTFDDAIRTIKKVETVHKVLRKRCEREVIVWE